MPPSGHRNEQVEAAAAMDVERRGSFRTRAAPVEFFFEERYLGLAKTFCTGCPAKRRCYGYAQQQIQRGYLIYGVWGGRVWSEWVDE